MNIFRRIINAIAPEMPGDYSRLDLLDGLGGPVSNGRVRCSRCDTWYGLDDDHTCTPTNAQVLAMAFPWHPVMDDWAARDREIQDILARYRANGGRIVPATLTDPTREAAA